MISASVRYPASSIVPNERHILKKRFLTNIVSISPTIQSIVFIVKSFDYFNKITLTNIKAKINIEGKIKIKSIKASDFTNLCKLIMTSLPCNLTISYSDGKKLLFRP